MAGEKIGKYDEEVIQLSNLELDKSNPRIGEHPDQNSTINAMLNRKSTDIDHMAESIVRNGFLTLELPCVYPSKNKGKYVIAEGNRRLTALKVLHTPDLANGSKKYQKFKKLSEQSKGALPNKIRCAVFKNARDCLPYVLMRHGLGSDGASLRRWDALEKRRMDEKASGKPHQGLRVIDFVLDQGNLSDKHEVGLDVIKITNLERLTDSATVRKLLEVKKDDCINSAKGEAWLVPVWQRILEIILDEEHQGNAFSVKNIYTADNQEEFIHQVLNEVHGIPIPVTAKGKGSNSSSSSSGGGSGASGSGKSNKSAKGAAAGKPTKHQTTKQRTGLIEKKFSPEGLAPQKIIDLVDELKKLPVKSHRNCAGVMFRVFTDLSIDHYMKTHKIQKTKKLKGADVNLSEKEKRAAVIKHMKDKKVLSDARLLKALEDTMDVKHPVSAESLNHYVHSSSQIPDADALKAAWSNLQHIFEVFWEK